MSKAWSAVKGRLIAVSYAVGWWLVCRVPESWGRWVFQQAGDIAWRRQGPSVQVLEGNLRRVIGPDATGKELRALSRAGMSSYARYWFEVFRLPVISRERIVDQMGFVPGEDATFAALNAGRGVVLALPHMGNWDQAGVWIIAEGAPKITVVAERLEPESLARRFFGFREQLGFEVLPATGGTARFGILAQRLRGGRPGLPADRTRRDRYRHRGGLLRGEGADDGRSRGAGGADRRGPDARHALVQNRRLGSPHP